MKEPIEYSLTAIIIVLLFIASSSILASMVAPIDYKLDLEAMSLLDKITLTAGQPENWGEAIINGNELEDFGLSSNLPGHLDKGKVNALTFRALGSFYNTTNNPFYMSPEDFLLNWISLQYRGFIIDFIPALNISITVTNNNVEIKTYNNKGKNITPLVDVNVIVVTESVAGVNVSLFSQPVITVNDEVKVVAAIAYYNSTCSISYWVDEDVNCGFAIDRFIISCIELNANEVNLLQVFRNYTVIEYTFKGKRTNPTIETNNTDEGFKWEVNFSPFQVDEDNSIYVYEVLLENSFGGIDDEVVFLLAYNESVISVFFTYPAPIHLPNGYLNIINLRYGGLTPPTMSGVASKFVFIGFANYLIKLYMWRASR
ncbi:MAG: hypothetical protein NDF55_05275 [archaeon GB-1867-005]|nr:hypothetical protein [Candidatus Culexmicrobium cathedralense]